MPFILRHLHLFTALDTQWVCTTCVAAITAGRLPALAAINELPAPWVDLPPGTADQLSVEEVEILGLTTVFTVVDGLSVGLLGRGGPSKTLFLTEARAESVPTRLALTRSRREVLSLHSRPPTLPPSSLAACWTAWGSCWTPTPATSPTPSTGTLPCRRW